MNYRMIGNVIGKVLWVEAAFLLPALVISAARGEAEAVRGILCALCACLAAGLPLGLAVKPKRTEIYARDGLATAGLSWLSVSLFGALPFRVSGAMPNYIDCLFETASGFTTTGATILSDIEALPAGLLYWRSFTHWLGGMGVLVFLLILNPLSGTRRGSGESMHLLRAESPGVRITKLVPRMKDSAKILYLIYITLTVLMFLFLFCGGNTVFDSVTLTFGTAGTGGFTIRNDSAASYSAYTQWVITVFMLLFSVNFNVYFLLLLRQFKKAAKNEELRGLLCIIFFAVAVIMVNTRSCFASFGESLRHVTFQVLTILSTSGFITVDFDRWPELSRAIMLLLMFCGACAGSTGGGLKVVRVQLLFKSAYRSISRAFRPNTVKLIHADGEIIDDRTVSSVGTYFILYMGLLALATLLISPDGFSFETNFSAAVSCMNNVGPGLGGVGAVQNYGAYSGFSKLVLTLTMLIGRLEIYPMLVLFFPSAWKR